tara:strand:+ start:637 stop:1269 length:633 start_codon:yes stop_codon:yes gene_type:complete
MNNDEFQNLLLEMIYEDDDNDDNEEQRTCLISGDKLEKNHIKLSCGHKFNFHNIFNEVIKQKCQNNYNETQHLKKHQIKCPYCRTVQNYLLPQVEGFAIIKYVNSPLKYVMMPNKCKQILKSGKRKGEMCGKPCFGDYCSFHKKYNNKKKEKTVKIKNKITCKHIIKRGKRKGEVCGKKLTGKYVDLCYCASHWKQHITVNDVINNIIEV